MGEAYSITREAVKKNLVLCFRNLSPGINGPSQSWKRGDQCRGQLGITTVYGAEFQTEKGVWS
jgi:hypothetical protein